MSTKSTIHIDVLMDANRVPETIAWQASDTGAESAQKAKALMLSFWDGADKAALRIDLWTKDMMIDEMADFFYQTLMSMGDTYQRATRNGVLAQEIKKFAQAFYKKFQDEQMKLETEGK